MIVDEKIKAAAARLDETIVLGKRRNCQKD